MAGTIVLIHGAWMTPARWDGFAGRYRTLPGQTYGWDVVLALGAAWFLDNGAGSERYIGTFRGQGISAAPLVCGGDQDGSAASQMRLWSRDRP